MSTFFGSLGALLSAQQAAKQQITQANAAQTLATITIAENQAKRAHYAAVASLRLPVHLFVVGDNKMNSYETHDVLDRLASREGLPTSFTLSGKGLIPYAVSWANNMNLSFDVLRDEEEPANAPTHLLFFGYGAAVKEAKRRFRGAQIISANEVLSWLKKRNTNAQLNYPAYPVYQTSPVYPGSWATSLTTSGGGGGSSNLVYYAPVGTGGGSFNGPNSASGTSGLANGGCVIVNSNGITKTK